MSFFGRLGTGLGGLVDVPENFGLFFADVGKAFWDDPDGNDGFFQTVWGSGVDRLGQMAGGAIGPRGFGGQLFGAIPGQVRKYPAAVIGTGISEDDPGFGWHEAFGGGITGFLEGAGREFIREPLSTAVTAASLSQSETFGGDSGMFGFAGLGTLFEGKTWSRAHQIAQTRSMGQAISMAVLTKDILDEDELIKAQASPYYNVISGGFDLAARIWLDTDALLGGVALEPFKTSKFASETRGLSRAQKLLGGGADYRVARLVEDDARARKALGRIEKSRERALKIGEFAEDGEDDVARGLGKVSTTKEGKVLTVEADNDLERVLRGESAVFAKSGGTFDEEAFVAEFKKNKGRKPSQGLIDSERRRVESLAGDLPDDPSPVPVASFGDEDDAQMAATSQARRIVTTAVGTDAARALDIAVDAARRGNTGPLYKWADAHKVDIARNLTADLMDPAKATAAYDNIAKLAADAQGFNTIHILDDAGEIADRFDLGNRDYTLDKSISATQRAKKRMGLSRELKYDNDLYEDVLSRRDFRHATFEAFRRGGWDGALDHARGRVDVLSANLKAARDDLVRGPQWNDKVLPWLAKQDELPLGRRIEVLRDRLFHDAADGDMMATHMALARDDRTRTSLMRYFMGDNRTVEELRALDPAMARDLETVMKRRFVARNYAPEGVFQDVREEFELFNDPDRWAADPKFATWVDSISEGTTDVQTVLDDIEFYVRGRKPAYMDATTKGVGRKVLTDAQETALNHIRRAEDGLSVDELKGALGDGATATRGGYRPTRTVQSLEKRGLIEIGEDGRVRAAMHTVGEVSDGQLELERLMAIAGQSKNMLSLTGRGGIRANEVVQKVWQSKHNKLRVVFDMAAHPFLMPEDPMVVAKLKRHLRDAGIEPERMQEYLGQFSAIRWNENARESFLNEMNAQAVSSLALKHGIDQEVVEKVIAEVASSQSVASSFLKKAVRYGGRDRVSGKQFSRVTLVDAGTGATDHIFVPFTPEQLANAHVMPNFREIDKSLKRMAKWSTDLDGPVAVGKEAARVGHAKALVTMDHLTRIPTGMADLINKAWKPAVLLRPAWPMRVVFDEQVRMMSVMGTMATIAGWPAATRELKMNYMRDLFRKTDKDGNALFLGVDPDTGKVMSSNDFKQMRLAKPMADPKKATKAGAIVGGAVGFALGGPQGALAGAGLGAWRFGRNAQYANGLQALYLSSTRNLAFDGYKFAADMGAPGDIANVARDEISAGRQLDTILQRDPTERMARIRFDPRRWRNYDPGESGYREMWNNVVNKQFGNSKFAHKLWDDNLENDEIVRWLQKDPEGRKTLRQMPKVRRENPEEWVEEARSFLNANVMPPVPELATLRRRMSEGGHVNYDEVVRALGGDGEAQQMLGSVHGNEIIQIMGQRDPMVSAFKSHLDNAFEHLGKTPTDTLSRQPFFASVYREEIEKQVARMGGPAGARRLSQKQIDNMQDQARRIGIHKTRTLLYDLAEESHFAQSVRFMMPFFNAYQEVLTRYAGIAVNNPLFASRAVKAYRGVDEIGTTYKDDFGNTVQRFHLPEWAKGLVDKGIFKGAVDDQGYVTFPKQSISMLGEGVPGFGPIVNVTLSQVVKDKPELEESLAFIFPYGLQSGAATFLPTPLRRVAAVTSEDRSYNTARANIAKNRIVALNEAGTPLDTSDPEVVRAFYAEVDRQAKQFFMLRTATGFLSPVPLNYQSPYQDAIDVWRKLEREDPDHAEERFLADYGEDFFALTQAVSRVNDGVPATIPGEIARKKYVDLIEAHPEFGSLIIGEEGGGVGVRFSRTIYDKQFREAISTGNPTNRRESLPLDEIVRKPESRLGWEHWRRFNDWKVDAMDRLGITSLASKDGEAIARVQQSFVESMAQKYPAWYDEYVDQDETKWLRRIRAFNDIVNTDHEGLHERPDIVGLRNWLGSRRAVESALAKREAEGGSASLSSKSNTDLRLAWDAMQAKLSANNPMFSDLAARWLNNDRVERNTWMSRNG